MIRGGDATTATLRAGLGNMAQALLTGRPLPHLARETTHIFVRRSLFQAWDRSFSTKKRNKFRAPDCNLGPKGLCSSSYDLARLSGPPRESGLAPYCLSTIDGMTSAAAPYPRVRLADANRSGGRWSRPLPPEKEQCSSSTLPNTPAGLPPGLSLSIASGPMTARASERSASFSTAHTGTVLPASCNGISPIGSASRPRRSVSASARAESA